MEYECPNSVGEITLKLQQLGLKPMALIFNNETFKDSYGVIPYLKEPEVCYEGYPHIMLYFIPQSKSAISQIDNFDGKKVNIEILDENGKLLSQVSGNLKRSVSPITPAVLSSEVRLSQKLPKAKYAMIHLDSYHCKVETSPFVKVWGKVTDFHGKPCKKAYILFVNPYGFPGGTAITRTDKNGNYSMFVPPATYHHVFICDGRYGREALEFYGWNVVVEPPELKLDARFDKIEIYRLTAAETPDRTLLIEFVPMDIAHTNKELNRIYQLKGKVTPEDASEKLYPPLSKNNVKAYLNEEELEIRTFSKRHYLPKDFGIQRLMPAYILEAKIPRHIPMGKYNLKIVIHKEVENLEEWGEAILFNLNI